MQPINGSFLEYGALGLLAVFLTYVMWAQGKRDQKASEERERSEQFVQGLVGGAMEESARQMVDWRGMVAQTLDVYSKVASSYDAVNEQLAENCEAIRNGNKATIDRSQTLYNAFTQVERQVDELRKEVAEEHGQIIGRLDAHPLLREK